ncbi:MAG: leucine-rich repeat protein [Prevotellaceae bacterium]|jgi:hypothetical protein|nr:leucine-rich repeat protein [Prevotellaceae bacterium]
MKKICISIMTALCFCAFTNKAMGQTWGSDVCADHSTILSSNITATLNTSTGLLSITGSGYGKMADFSYAGNDNGTPPWYALRSSIRTVIIGEGVTNIGNNAFKNCSNLTSVTIASTVTRIGVTSFMNCTNLTSITIPSCVSTIEGGAFYGCSNLTVNSRMSNPTIEYFPNASKPNFYPAYGTEYPFNGISKLRVLPDLYSSYPSGTYTKEILYDEVLLPAPKYDPLQRNGETRHCDNGCVVYKVSLQQGVNYTFNITNLIAIKVYDGYGAALSSTAPSNYTGDAYVKVGGDGYGLIISGSFTLTYRGYLSTPLLNNILAPSNCSQVSLSWGSVPAAASYDVYRSTSSSGTYTLIKSNVTGTSTTDTPPSNDTYYYKVKAIYNSTIYSDLSVDKNVSYNCTTITPPTVITKAATQVTNNSAQLNKTVTAGTETISVQGFKYRKKGTGAWTTSANGNLTSLTAGTEYEFYAYATTTTTTQQVDGSILTFTTLQNPVTTYIVTVPQISNVNISPSGAVNVVSGSSQEFIVTPNDGYEVSSILVNGNSVFYIIVTTNGIKRYHFTIENVTANSTVSVILKAKTSGIEEQQAKGITIFPNPTKDEIFIKSENEIEKIEVVDITGRTVGANNYSPSQNGAINISALPAGVYLVKIFVDGQSITKKIIKE